MADRKSVFISYSSKDRAFVDRIVRKLEEMGIYCWQAPEHIPAGSSYAKEIPKAIRECEVFLLFLSERSQDSIWVEKETDSAISERKNIIPFQIDDAPLNETFRFYLNNVQMIYYAQNPEMAMRELEEELKYLAQPMETSDGTEANDTEATGHVQKQPTAEAVTGQSHMSFARQPRNTNALRINRIPLTCRNCGSKNLSNVSMGIYRCDDCGTENYDDYQTVRNYLDKVGMAPALVIEKETGVPRRVINYFFKQEYLEIPKSSTIRVPCERCGAPIRTGTLCDACKSVALGTAKREGCMAFEALRRTEIKHMRKRGSAYWRS